jgi:SynChlorMet cassette protein ScmD
MMNETESNTVTANSLIVLREEFDDWAILFDPDTGNTFCINPMGVLIWKNLDGQQTVDEITEKIRDAALHVPSDVTAHVRDFIGNALRFGLAKNNVPRE